MNALPKLWASVGSQKMKFVVVTGGVISSIGKGITSSSIGLLLQRMGCASA
jgi:hypothetical protein